MRSHLSNLVKSIKSRSTFKKPRSFTPIVLKMYSKILHPLKTCHIPSLLPYWTPQFYTYFLPGHWGRDIGILTPLYHRPGGTSYPLENLAKIASTVEVYPITSAPLENWHIFLHSKTIHTDIFDLGKIEIFGECMSVRTKRRNLTSSAVGVQWMTTCQ